VESGSKELMMGMEFPPTEFRNPSRFFVMELVAHCVGDWLVSI
jgi:hypothetical protein